MKKFKFIVVILMCIFLTSGCFKRDSMDNISIVTTTYPIEYLIDSIYGYNSNITSIYPNGVDNEEYTLTDKKLTEYAKNDLFIYNGLSNEKNVAASLLNKNNNLKILDVSKGISLQRDVEELWLSPSNYLMLAQNIKNTLVDYTNSTVVTQEIEDNYDDLKLTISKYDADLKIIADNATNKDVVVGNDVFKFLEKYGFNVLSVEDNDNFVQSEYTQAKTDIQGKKVSYVFILDTDDVSDNTQKMVDAGATVVEVNSLANRSEEEASENYSYEEMMNDFIEILKEEVYN